MSERRALVIYVSREIFRRIRYNIYRLPEGVMLAGHEEQIDCDRVLLRLEGPGLPDWVEPVPEGAKFPEGTMIGNMVHGMVFYRLEPLT